MAIALFVIGSLVMWFIIEGGKDLTKGISNKLSNSSDAKEYCAKQHDVINAKTDFAAEKAYKVCISNY